MKRVYGSDDRMLVGLLHDLLQRHGIDCMIRNDFLAGGAGELPPNECWPELWVVDSDDWARARRLVDDQINVDCAPPWECPGCGERIDGQFAQCWQCGRAAPREDGGS